jgi:hypothetical protein
MPPRPAPQIRPPRTPHPNLIATSSQSKLPTRLRNKLLIPSCPQILGTRHPSLPGGSVLVQLRPELFLGLCLILVLCSETVEAGGEPPNGSSG